MFSNLPRTNFAICSACNLLPTNPFNLDLSKIFFLDTELRKLFHNTIQIYENPEGKGYEITAGK